MRIRLTGSSGQLGQALRSSLSATLAGESMGLIATDLSLRLLRA